MIATILIKKAPNCFLCELSAISGRFIWSRTKLIIFGNFFQALVILTGMQIGQKFWPTRSANTLEITQKKFSCIWDKYWRIHMGPYKSHSRFRLSLRKAPDFLDFGTQTNIKDSSLPRKDLSREIFSICCNMAPRNEKLLGLCNSQKQGMMQPFCAMNKNNKMCNKRN